MNKMNILVVGTNENNLQQTVTNLNTQQGWNAVCIGNTEAAIEKLFQQDFDVLVVTEATAAAATKLKKIASLQQEEMIIIENTNADKLIDEINAALSQAASATTTYSFVDDALKNAMLPITVQ